MLLAKYILVYISKYIHKPRDSRYNSNFELGERCARGRRKEFLFILIVKPFFANKINRKSLLHTAIKIYFFKVPRHCICHMFGAFGKKHFLRQGTPTWQWIQQ